jgi:hypothetical protein
MCIKIKQNITISCLTLSVLTGCGNFPLKNPQQYDEIMKTTTYIYTANEKDNPIYYLTAYKQGTCPKKIEVRNTILFEQMRLIDDAYYDYESTVRRLFDGKKLLVDIASIGISSAASIIGGAGIKSILALADTRLKGPHSSFDNDYLQDKATDVIISQMRSSRAKVAKQMIENMKDKECQYSIENGIF